MFGKKCTNSHCFFCNLFIDLFCSVEVSVCVCVLNCFVCILCSAKIKNIISTEEAKAKLIAEQRNKKKDNGTSFVPTNIAVNYVQHNRCEYYPSVLTYTHPTSIYLFTSVHFSIHSMYTMSLFKAFCHSRLLKR